LSLDGFWFAYVSLLDHVSRLLTSLVSLARGPSGLLARVWGGTEVGVEQIADLLVTAVYHLCSEVDFRVAGEFGLANVVIGNTVKPNSGVVVEQPAVLNVGFKRDHLLTLLVVNKVS